MNKQQPHKITKTFRMFLRERVDNTRPVRNFAAKNFQNNKSLASLLNRISNRACGAFVFLKNFNNLKRYFIALS